MSGEAFRSIDCAIWGDEGGQEDNKTRRERKKKKEELLGTSSARLGKRRSSMEAQAVPSQFTAHST
jgi:hypothetical protein